MSINHTMHQVRHLPRRVVLTAVLVGVVLLVAASPASAAISDKRNDFTNDGVSDILAVNAIDNCLYRWSGNGSGGFGAAVQVGCGWEPYFRSTATPGDLNRDGRGDLVAINADDRCLYRWLGNGSGGFGGPTLVGCGWDDFIGNLTGAGDLNNDGNGDLVAISEADQCLYRWLGNGSGGFGAVAFVGCGWNDYERMVTGAGDINGDGNADLVALNASDQCLHQWLGNGSGGFTSTAVVGCGWGPFLGGPGNIAGMGDLNHDGIGDLVSIDQSFPTGCLTRWLGNGAASYGQAVQIGCGWNPYFLAA